MKSAICLWIIVSILCLPVRTESSEVNHGFFFHVDYARFRNDDQSGYLELYFAFYQNFFTFVETDGCYRGVIDIGIRITGDDLNERVVDQRSFLPIRVHQLQRDVAGSTVMSQAGFVLPFGTYTVEVIVADSLMPATRDSLWFPLNIEGYGSNVQVSDIQLCSRITPSTDTNDPFYKNTLEVLPNPSLVYGAQGYPVVFAYSEMYNLTPYAIHLVRTEVQDMHGEIVREATKNVQYHYRNTVELSTVNVATFPSGRYRFCLTIYDQNGIPLAHSCKQFFVNNPHISQRPASATLVESELASLNSDQLTEEFRRARYIASERDIREFEELTTAEAKRKFLVAFWSEVEKGRVGTEPMSRAQYIERVEKANDRYTALGKKGWLSDRGRVYILYGEPSEIERFPSTGVTKPYEVWKYYHIENGVVFVFVDRWGVGDYQLVHSTKRGELRDEMWRVYLR